MCFSSTLINFSGSFVTCLGTTTIVRPCSKEPQISGALSTKVSAVLNIVFCSLSENGSSRHCHSSRLISVACGSFTPLGTPVLPDVYKTIANSSESSLYSGGSSDSAFDSSSSSLYVITGVSP